MAEGTGRGDQPPLGLQRGHTGDLRAPGAAASPGKRQAGTLASQASPPPLPSGSLCLMLRHRGPKQDSPSAPALPAHKLQSLLSPASPADVASASRYEIKVHAHPTAGGPV